MTKPASEKRVSFRGEKATEDDPEPDDPDKREKSKKRIGDAKRKDSTTAEKFPYRRVVGLKPVVEVPPVPAKYFRQEENKKQPAYKHATKVEEGVDLEELLSRFEDNRITLTQKELLALAPRLREAMKNNITKKRVPTKEVAVLAEVGEETEGESETDPEDGVASTCQFISVNALRTEPLAERPVEETDEFVGSDPVLQYLSRFSSEESRTMIFSVGEKDRSSAQDVAELTVIPAMINGIREEEALLDSGSQVVMMSREAATDCKLSWDPNLKINMQSANGQVSRTCGLAKNVPFTFGDLTVKLQVHVIEDAPYRVLLGRPFDLVTASEVINHSDGRQYVKLRNNETENSTCIPTYSRGQLPSKPSVNF